MHKGHAGDQAAGRSDILPAVLQRKCTHGTRHAGQQARCVRLCDDGDLRRICRKLRRDVLDARILYIELCTVLALQVADDILRLLALSNAQHGLTLQSLEALQLGVAADAIQLVPCIDIDDDRTVLRIMVGPCCTFRRKDRDIRRAGDEVREDLGFTRLQLEMVVSLCRTQLGLLHEMREAEGRCPLRKLDLYRIRIRRLHDLVRRDRRFKDRLRLRCRRFLFRCDMLHKLRKMCTSRQEQRKGCRDHHIFPCFFHHHLAFSF